jgi:pyrimidine operon attenuation protein/uracil phosphoribosyltransferase
MNQEKVILNSYELNVILNRLCYQLIESHDNFSDSILIGLQPRGVFLARKIIHQLSEITSNTSIQYGELDSTFFRDDFRRREHILMPNQTNIDFLIENKKVVLIDDVLYTGRSIRSSLDSIVSFGRPKSIELLVLINRRFSREIPIEPKYIGKSVDVINFECVKVNWEKNNVLLLNE